MCDRGSGSLISIERLASTPRVTDAKGVDFNASEARDPKARYDGPLVVNDLLRIVICGLKRRLTPSSTGAVAAKNGGITAQIVRRLSTSRCRVRRPDLPAPTIPNFTRFA